MANRQDVLPPEAGAAPAQGAAPAHGAVESLIDRFGGLRPMADKLGAPVSTVQGWKKRGAIPASRQADIRAAVVRLGLGDLGADFESAFRHDESVAAPKPAPAPEAASAEPKSVELQTPEPKPVEPKPAEAPSDGGIAVAAASSPVVKTPAAHRQEVTVTEVRANEARADDNRPQSSQGAGAAIAAALLAVIGAAVSVTAPLWSHDYLQRANNTAGIEKRTTAAEDALKAADAQRAALADRIGGVEKSLAALEARVAKAPTLAGALAARDLLAALAAGGAFALESAAVRASGIAGADEAALLAALAPYANKGVPTTSALLDRLGGGSAVSDLPARMWTWASGVMGGAAASVNVSGIAEALRLKEPSATASPAATAAESPPVVTVATEAAEMRSRGDLAGLVGVVERADAADGVTAEATAAWLADAKARLAADKLAVAIAAKAEAALR